MVTATKPTKGKKSGGLIEPFDPRQAIEQRFSKMRELSQKRSERERSFDKAIEDLEAKLAQAKEDRALKVDPLSGQVQALESEIVEIATKHRSCLLEGSKSKTLKFAAGTVSWAKNQDTVELLGEPDAVAEELLSLGHDDLVKVSKTPIKAAMLNKPGLLDQLRLARLQIGTERIKVELTKL